MRKSEGKKLGYVILPVVIPSGMNAKDALDDNKIYKVVWGVLQALRSHDDRFDSYVNKMDLMNDPSGKMEIVAVTDTVKRKTKRKSKKGGKGKHTIGVADKKADYEVQHKLTFDVGELEKALYARLVKKCGNRMYWEDWANDIAEIAQTHIGRIKAILKNPKNEKEVKAFGEFADELRDDLNDSISDDEVVEMLAQHLITKPVFDALFADYSFASNNPVSLGMQRILDLLQEHRLDKEADTLNQFYESVKRRADGIDKAEGKQKIVVELYDKFFRNAFPKMTERLGIVYTPVEVVDFIIHSVNDILQDEFGQTLGSEGVHILDPFTGTGTFITRLMQSGLIAPEQLPEKYKNEIHCNEIVLLAYYIAAINIEAVYHSIVGDKHEPFDGICLTDTFQMYESEDLIEQFFPDNSERRKRQKKLDIRVIVGNPPYSAGQKSMNDNSGNVGYPSLDGRIRETYAARSSAKLKTALYDSYIRAIRWASDRVGESGIIGFVTNAGFIEANTADGLRKCLSEEFSSIYVFHLRGNQRTQGELSRKEGGKIFGSGSRAPIAVTLLVKKPEAKSWGQIRFHNIGDYLTREQKLAKTRSFGSIAGVAQSDGWEIIAPDEHGDWLNQRDDSFEAFISIGSKKETASPSLFNNYSQGIMTGRDYWCINSSRELLLDSISRTSSFFNGELARYKKDGGSADINKFIDTDSSKISWTGNIKKRLERGKPISSDDGQQLVGCYRPFFKQWFHYSRVLNERVYQMPKIFPDSANENLVIGVMGTGESQHFSVLISRNITEYKTLYNGQNFPLYLYEVSDGREKDPSDSKDLFARQLKQPASDQVSRTDGISDAGLAHFQQAYPAGQIAKEDLFYYIYGMLHSPEYRERYKDNLSKELPRIPAVKKFGDFQAFSQAGRDLARWHLDYETVDCHEVTIDVTDSRLSLENHNIVVFKTGVRELRNKLKLNDDHFYVRKMKFPNTKDPETKKSVKDKTSIIYNEYITVRDIPLEAYDYVVNGKPAIEWVMDRQSVKTDLKSGIVNDANLWATETMENAAYPLELLLRVITVSLETNRIVAALPKLEID